MTHTRIIQLSSYWKEHGFSNIDLARLCFDVVLKYDFYDSFSFWIFQTWNKINIHHELLKITRLARLFARLQLHYFQSIMLLQYNIISLTSWQSVTVEWRGRLCVGWVRTWYVLRLHRSDGSDNALAFVFVKYILSELLVLLPLLVIERWTRILTF